MSIIPLQRKSDPTDEGTLPEETTRVPDGPKDEDLVRHLAAGDTNALEALISRFWNPLTSYASRLLDDVALAEDVVQEVFVRVWEGRSTWKPRSIQAYLYRVTRNLALDDIRSRGARHEREQAHGAISLQTPFTPADIFEEHQLGDALDAAIQALPSRQREAFTLAHLRKLTYQEVAEVMEISPKTVGHHVSAALGALRSTLRHHLAERLSTDS